VLTRGGCAGIRTRAATEPTIATATATKQATSKPWKNAADALSCSAAARSPEADRPGPLATFGKDVGEQG
jgi:hypothetical protein